MRLCILIVEDDPQQSSALERLLRIRLEAKLPDIFWEFVIVTTLAEGLTEAPKANVTILDLGLPDSDAPGTIESIGKFRPPVIVMTGNDDPEIWAACKARGADHVFVKGQIHGLCSVLLDSVMKDVLITNGLLNAA